MQGNISQMWKKNKNKKTKQNRVTTPQLRYVNDNK